MALHYCKQLLSSRLRRLLRRRKLAIGGAPTVTECQLPYPQDGSRSSVFPEQFFNCAEGKHFGELLTAITANRNTFELKCSSIVRLQ